MEEVNYYASYSKIRFPEVNIKVFITLRLVIQSSLEYRVDSGVQSF
jgi:hypothetical protein